MSATVCNNNWKVIEWPCNFIHLMRYIMILLYSEAFLKMLFLLREIQAL